MKVPFTLASRNDNVSKLENLQQGDILLLFRFVEEKTATYER